MDSSVAKLKKKIESTGYYRVVLRPTQFVNGGKMTLHECDRALSESVVSLRGWDYPHLNSKDKTIKDNCIQYLTKWKHYHEICRFYQSGQFFHMFSFREDYTAGDRERFLSLISTVYTFTEIFEFASRLAARGVFSPLANVQLSLHGLDGRILSDWEYRYFSRDYICHEPSITFAKQIHAESLIARSAELAREAYVHLFHRFGWLDIGNDFMIEDQKKFLERRG